jgi:hypothetical protein
MENINQFNKLTEDTNHLKLSNTNPKRKSFQIKKSIENLSEILKNKKKIKEMAEQSIEGKTENEIRSILWRIYLDIISYNNIEDIKKEVTESRLQYKTKLEKYHADDYITYINSQRNEEQTKKFLGKLEIFNRFVQEEKIKRQTNFLDSIHLIKLDVNRTFQEIDLFRNKKIIDSISRILYIWNFENTDVSYCQGMNEIAGTIYYALFPSYLLSTYEEKFENNFDEESSNFNLNENLLKEKFSNLTINTEKENESDDFYLLNSDKYVEADVFAIFSQIMKRGFKDLYNYNDQRFRRKTTDENLIREKGDLLCIEDINKMEISHLKKRIYKIFHIYLKIIDYILYEFVGENCEPFIFLFRWILCILNREISIKNIIYVWDAIFAVEFLDRNFEKFKENSSIKHTNFHFLDFLCVSMIKNIKYHIINEEDTCKVLSTLMNYPNEINLRQIISDALIIRAEIFSYLNEDVESKKREKFKIDKNYILI